jgi:hypothetical protein
MLMSFFIFKGRGYTQETDKDILLLDISNDNEYVWKTSFDLKKIIPTTTVGSIPTSQFSPSSINNVKANIIVGAVIGAIIGIVVTLGSFFFYKRKKHTKKQDIKESTSQNIKDEKILYISSENDDNLRNDKILLIPGNTSSTIQQNGERNEAISEVIVQNSQNDSAAQQK